MRRFRDSRSTRRREGHIHSKPVLLMVCEGKTEATVLDALRQRWRIRTASVLLIGQAGVPRSIVAKAKQVSREKKPDEVWVVFDRDTHLSWDSARDQALALGFKLAISNPCIELWGLLLHQDQFAALDHHTAQSKLARVHAGFHHKSSPYFRLELVLKGRDEAQRRAKALQTRADSNDDPFGCPTTTFSALIARLEALR